MDRWDMLRAADDLRKRQALAALRVGVAVAEARMLADRYESNPPFGFTERTGRELRGWADRCETLAREEIERDLADASKVEKLAEEIEAEVASCWPLTWDEEQRLRKELAA